jgi:hypothetical protein
VSVPVAVTLEQVREELVVAAQYAAAAGLALDASGLSEERPVFYLSFRNRDGALFFAEVDCTDYPMYPPFIEFTDGAGRGHSARAERRHYPSCFHGMPCVCARYNRKAYGAHGGPHGDWRMIDWQLPTSNGIAIDTLAMIVSDMHSKIVTSSGGLG